MNFALILFVLMVVTGILWLADVLVFRKKRAANVDDPMWVEWGASFFPVIVLVFGLRSFIIEPFKIPSGSMIPTLLAGDFILVNKYTYGIRLPIINKKVVDMNEPKRGDVMVFRYPMNEDLDFIKRVVGLPGDVVEYRNKQLLVNGELQPKTGAGSYFHENERVYSQLFNESLGSHKHQILNDQNASGELGILALNRSSCEAIYGGLRCTVPAGHYFVMGDNRDGSSDSRVWGFVPEQNIVGKAFMIWWNFSDLSRVGRFQ